MKILVAMLCALLVCCAIAIGSTLRQASSATELKNAMEKVLPLHETITKPGPNDWLSQHREPGQTFQQYLKSRPVTAHGSRKILYIQPIGPLSETEQKVVTMTAEYMRLFFNLDVKTRKSIPLSSIPAAAQRIHPTWGDKQILSTYVLNRVLQPRLPRDAAAMIAFTASDLWPGQGWNFVFGQASIRGRVGVWSIYRNGDPDIDEHGFKVCLMRTIKTAVHETGHMFSMYHCTAYECCMCGSNHREESDRRPVYLCPECMAKVCWATRTDPVERYRKLAAFCKRNGFEEEQLFFEESIKKLTVEVWPPEK